MPRGPKGEKRPADVIGNAVHVMRIATGEAKDEKVSEGRTSAGSKGGRSRANHLTPEQRADAASRPSHLN